MLQIATGRFNQPGPSRENKLSGIVYSNARLEECDEGLSIALGRISQTPEEQSDPSPLVVEITERMAGTVMAPGVLWSHGAGPYMDDMAILMSFALRCTCSIDPERVRRLTTASTGRAPSNTPAHYVKRAFAPKVLCTRADQQDLVELVDHVLQLERSKFLASMRAIRTYVTGIHRFGEDPALAYTLLVAALEALAQELDVQQTDWSELEPKKRLSIDSALFGADATVADKVRAAVLSNEHVALKKKFLDFVLGYVDDTYFQAGLTANDRPIAKNELGLAMRAAYDVRSLYIHRLRALPKAITEMPDHGEWVLVDEKPMLSAQGIARLAHYVIWKFVMEQPRVAPSPYDHFLERSGVMTATLSPEYWIANPAGDLAKSGAARLSGFLDQVAGFLLAKTTISDLTPLLQAVAAKVSGMKTEHRLPYLALWAIFCCRFRPVDGVKKLETKAAQELGSPSVESMLTFVEIDTMTIPWPLVEHRRIFDKYVDERFHKGKVKAPRLFEAAAALQLAERYRVADDQVSSLSLVREASLNYPESDSLRAFASTYSANEQIQWRSVLLPPAVPAATVAAAWDAPASSESTTPGVAAMPVQTSESAKSEGAIPKEAPRS